jgi:hypothetical protein
LECFTEKDISIKAEKEEDVLSEIKSQDSSMELENLNESIDEKIKKMLPDVIEKIKS